MEQYLEATTVHGFSYLHRRNSAFDRILWIAIIVTGFSLASFIIHDSVMDWEENQTITTLESITRPIQEVQFPTVTVCPNEQSPHCNSARLNITKYKSGNYKSTEYKNTGYKNTPF